MNFHKVIALMLSPVTIALISSLGTYLVEPDLVGLIIAMILIAFCPVINVVRKSLRGEVDILVPDRSSRGPFFLQAIICYSVAFILLVLRGDFYMAVLSLSYLSVSLAVAILNAYITKVSVPMAGLVGPATFLLYLSEYWLGIFLLLLAPLLAWSRWKSESHTLRQIILGVVVSLIITSAVCSALWSFK